MSANPDVVEAEGHEHLARGHELIAKARRLRATPAASTPALEWVSPDASPLGKRRTLALARAGALESTKIGRKVLVRKTSLDAFLARHERGAVAPEQNEDLFGQEAAR